MTRMIAAIQAGLRILPLAAPATVAAWLAMMIVHESGHINAAWLSGGAVARVVLHPLQFSRTDLAHNPQPLFVAFAGCVWGCLAPLAIWAIARATRSRVEFLFRYFAGFCLVGNGAYLASALLTPVGDAADLLRLGAPLWTLVCSGTAAMVAGLALWNGLGKSFAVFANDRNALLYTWVAALSVVMSMLAWSAFQ
ncbi:MAG: hypothetical protein ACKVS9_17905 [Phycisphaerae bacterium]